MGLSFGIAFSFRCGGSAKAHEAKRWLMTLTAMRPDSGLEKGRDVSLWSVAQTSESISALRVVLRDLQGSLAPRK